MLAFEPVPVPVLSAPRVFVREIAPYMLSRWKVRYIVNPVLSTLSRRSLYQFPPGCMLHHFIISLFLARITRFPFSFAILFLLFPLPSSLPLFLARVRVSFFFIVMFIVLISRYNPGTLANNRPFSIPDPHYTIDLYRALRPPYLYPPCTRILFILGIVYGLFSLYRVCTTFDVNWTISEKIWIGRNSDFIYPNITAI